MADTSVVRTFLSARDRMIAALIGILFFVATLVWGVSGVDPSLWDEVAVAAGLRPPHDLFPGVWRLLTGWMFSAFGIRLSVRILALLGSLCGALSVMLAYLLTRQTLSWLLRTNADSRAWTKFLLPFFSAVSAVLFAVSSPLWDISQTFSSEGMRFLMLLASTHLWLRWFELGGNWRLFSVTALVGVQMAESPFAFLLPVFFLFWYFRLWHLIEDGGYVAPKHLPAPYEMPYWRMFFLFVGTLVAMICVNVITFGFHGGLEANGWSGTDAYFRYGTAYWRAFAGSSTIVGWALGMGFGIFPIVVALRLFPMLTQEDRPMSFPLGAAMFFVGCVALLQTGIVPSARFWLFMRDSVVVGSRALLSFYAFVTALAVALSGTCFAFECHRIYLLDNESRPGMLLRLVSPVLVLLLVVFAVRQVPRPVHREAQRVVDDAVAEIVEECGNAKWLFTDGRLDAGIEIAAKAHGKGLVPLNMMSGATEWENYMRVRSFQPGLDRDTAEIGIPALLRVWAGEKANGMDEAALQLGFEFWKRAQKPLPTLSGMVAREKGMDKATAERGIVASRALAERVLTVCRRMESVSIPPALASAVSAVSWRLSRFARLRNDEDLADRLDATNGAIKKMLSIVEYERKRTFMQMTPSEGLEIALKRADFVEARRYAAAVLRADPKHPEANFGTAMCFLKEGNLAEAEKYLRRVLEVRPDEPAALNNLSIICRKTKRYEEAVELAKHALRMLPDSDDVKRTLADAEAKKP